jgi:hypothetical protein
MRFTRAVFALVCAVIMTGCGSGGLLNLNPQPDGNIVVTDATSGAVLQTTSASPFLVSGGGFSIGLTESHFSGPFNVSVSKWTAPFNISCFVPHYVDQTDKTNVVKFSADNASPVTAPTQPSPCNPFYGTNGTLQTDAETATINDGRGHSIKFYYQIASASSNPTTPSRISLSWSGPSPAGQACGAYILNVGAVDSTGKAIVTTSANPITLSTTGGNYMGFSTATSTGSVTCPQNAGGSPGGTPTLQLLATPAQVLVYFNGYNASAVTTITATSVGTSPATLVIGNSTSNTVASIKLAWNGQAPSVGNCGAFILNVEAFDPSGTQIISSTYSNPITVSTNNAYWSGFSTVVAGISPAPPPTNLVCIPPPPTPPAVGSATLAVPNTATPTVVYYDGISGYGALAGNTTITATAVGVPSTSDGSITF